MVSCDITAQSLQTQKTHTHTNTSTQRARQNVNVGKELMNRFDTKLKPAVVCGGIRLWIQQTTTKRRF